MIKVLENCPKEQDIIDVVNAVIDHKKLKVEKIRGDAKDEAIRVAINGMCAALKVKRTCAEGCGYVAIREAVNECLDKSGLLKPKKEKPSAPVEEPTPEPEEVEEAAEEEAPETPADEPAEEPATEGEDNK